MINDYRIVSVDFEGFDGNPYFFKVGRDEVKEILQYYPRGEGDKGYITVIFDNGNITELYNYTRVDKEVVSK